MSGEILTPELIQTILGALITVISGLFVKEKIDKNKIVKYTDPNDSYNIPPKGISEATIKVVSQEDYGKETSTVAGNISSAGFVIGQGNVDLFKHNSRGIAYMTEPYTEVKQGDIPPIGIRLTPVKTGTVVVGYSLDGKDIKTVGQKTLGLLKNSPKEEWIFVPYSKYRIPDMELGEHKISIYQGYYNGHSDISGDQIEWFTKEDFIVEIKE